MRYDGARRQETNGMKHQTTKTKQTARRDQEQALQWTYAEGPPTRPWQWYAAVAGIALGIGLLIYLPTRDSMAPLLSMLLWGSIVIATSLAPSRDYEASLNRQLLQVRGVKRGRVTIERNLNEFATWKTIEYPEDRLNNLSRKLVLRRRDGKGTVEIALTGDDERDKQILTRVSTVVPAAPDIAPTLWERLDYLAQRWIGWR